MYICRCIRSTRSIRRTIVVIYTCGSIRNATRRLSSAPRYHHHAPGPGEVQMHLPEKKKRATTRTTRTKVRAHDIKYHTCSPPSATHQLLGVVISEKNSALAAHEIASPCCAAILYNHTAVRINFELFRLPLGDRDAPLKTQHQQQSLHAYDTRTYRLLTAAAYEVASFSCIHNQ